MLVDVFEWPSDMTATERAAIPPLEARARALLDYHRFDPRVAFDILDGHLFQGSFVEAERAIADLRGRVRIVVGPASGGPRATLLCVRFAWNNIERGNRDRAARNRAAEELADLGRRRRVLERLEANDLAGGPHPYLTTGIRDIARTAMTTAQWGSARDGRGICATCSAGPSMWCDEAVHAPPAAARTTLSAEGQATFDRLRARYATPITVSTADLEHAKANPLNLNATRLLKAVEAFDRAGAPMSPFVDNAPRPPAEDREYRREVLGEWSNGFGLTLDAPMPGTSSSYGLASGRALNASERFERFEVSYAYEGFAKKNLDRDRALAVDRLLLIMLRIAQAALRVRAGLDLWLGAVRGALRAWSASPELLELDIDHAPFGVDVTPPADDTAARYALLDLATPSTLHIRR